MQTSLLLTGGIVALLGVIVGSFINAVVWRLHKGISIAGKARSMCPNCERTLKWYDLIPVVSWIVLKAHCRYCKKPISKQYPITEITTGALWVLSYVAINPVSTLEFVISALWLIAVSVLVALAIYDIRWLELPDRLVVIFIVLTAVHALIITSTLDQISVLQRLDPLLGVGAIAGLFYILYQISDGKWIGGGDVKLAVGMGLLLGVQGSLLALFIAASLGSIYGLFGILVLKKKRDEVIPFGPFLIAGTIASYLYGIPIIDWYLQTLIV